MTDSVTEPMGSETAPLSLSDKFVGILTEPSTVFANLRDAGPRKSDWFVPLLVFALILSAATVLTMSNPTFSDQMRQAQNERMQEQVQQGKMTQEQAEMALDQMEQFQGVSMIFGVIGVMVTVPIFFFLIVFIYWALMKFVFHGAATFALMTSVSGLLMYYSAGDQILRILLMFVFGDINVSFSPALALLAQHKEMTFKLLSHLNPITLYATYLTGVGISTVAGLPRAKGLIIAFSLWAVIVILSVAVGNMFGM